MKQAIGGWNPDKCRQEDFVRENMSPAQASTLLKPRIISLGFGPGMCCILS